MSVDRPYTERCLPALAHSPQAQASSSCAAQQPMPAGTIIQDHRVCSCPGPPQLSLSSPQHQHQAPTAAEAGSCAEQDAVMVQEQPLIDRRLCDTMLVHRVMMGGGGQAEHTRRCGCTVQHTYCTPPKVAHFPPQCLLLPSRETAPHSCVRMCMCMHSLCVLTGAHFRDSRHHRGRRMNAHASTHRVCSRFAVHFWLSCCVLTCCGSVSGRGRRSCHHSCRLHPPRSAQSSPCRTACACVCACARVRACVCVCVCARARVQKSVDAQSQSQLRIITGVIYA